MPQFKLSINDTEYAVEADGNKPLLWILRDELGLTGTKYGCGIGQCGACTVHLNGKPVRSCSVPVSAVDGAPVTTIEGVANEYNHPVLKAWKDINVPQCGYCQTGQIMSAVALLRDNPRADDQEINNAMSGNICRCGTYSRIRKAIKQAAKE